MNPRAPNSGTPAEELLRELKNLLGEDAFRDDWRWLLPGEESAAPLQAAFVSNTDSKTASNVVAGPARSQRWWSQREKIMLALAATVLVGATAAMTIVLLREKESLQIIAATADVKMIPPRGGEAVGQEIVVRAERRGWATFVALVGENVEVYPTIGKSDGERVSDEAAAAIGPLDVPPGTQGLVVVTQTPATHYLRLSLQDRQFDDREDLRGAVQRILADAGHHWVAFRFVSIPNTRGVQ